MESTNPSNHLRRILGEYSLPRIIFHNYISANFNVTYKVARDTTVFTLSGKGYIPMNFMVNAGEYNYYPIIQLREAFDNPNIKANDKIYRVLYTRSSIYSSKPRITNEKDLEFAEPALSVENDCFFRIVVPTATSNTLTSTSMGVYAYMCTNLVVDMFSTMLERNRLLTHLLVSPLEVEELRDQGLLRGDYFVLYHKGISHKIKVIESKDLGVNGTYNINSSHSTEGTFRLGAGKCFNNYYPKNPNKITSVDSSPGETQIYGFHVDPEEPSALFSINKDWSLWGGTALQLGGEANLGFSVLYPDSICMGIIDRA